MLIKYLSHVLSAEVPVYGNPRANLYIRSVKSIEAGDPCRVYYMGMENHWGTHVDCPAHFFGDGKKITDYDADFWFFRNPQVIPVYAKSGQLIGEGELTTSINPDADLLILHSGWVKQRGGDAYSLRNPGLAPQLGHWLRNEYPLLRAIGIDWVSVSSYAHRILGREAHRVFLEPEGEGNPILIIEDMCIPENVKNLKEVWVVPLRVDNIDSAPCTVLGVFR